MTGDDAHGAVRCEIAATGELGEARSDCGQPTIQALALRIRREYEEMPGLHLTVVQAARLFGVEPDVAHTVLNDLSRTAVLTCSNRGTYSLDR